MEREPDSSFTLESEPGIRAWKVGCLFGPPGVLLGLGWMFDLSVGRGGPDMMPLGIPLEWLGPPTLLYLALLGLYFIPLGSGSKRVMAACLVGLTLVVIQRWPGLERAWTYASRGRECKARAATQKRRRGGEPLRLPVNWLGEAKVGDWAEYVYSQAEQPRGPVRLEVTRIEGDTVTVKAPRATLDLSRKSNPPYGDLLQLAGFQQPLEEDFLDDLLPASTWRPGFVGPQHIVSTTLCQPDCGEPGRGLLRAYFCDKVKVLGLDRLEYGAGLRTTDELLELRSYGTASQTLWAAPKER